ncbi:lysophospholipid acyltransferase family protein [Acetonema longum]|uniref:lysophospholipid acyltransferase family protein n=1 Tax=Acetonema longum TaxID=2374 RepID=UPI001EE65B76|nr:lysophospholipid acyltransferase family protein [Acetonema longum]
MRLISRIIRLLPDRAAMILGNVLGELCWHLVPRRRITMMLENIQRALNLDRGAAYRIAKQSATRFGRLCIEVLSVQKYSRQNIKDYVCFEGQEHMDEAVAYGRGVIVATCHSGNWEFMGAALSLNGYTSSAIAARQSNPQMDRFFNEQRAAAGLHIVYKSGVREVIRMLDAGHIIGVLMDQDAHRDGVFVDFLGAPASTPQGAAAFARLRNAPIVPTFITEISPGRHRIICHPIVWADQTGEREKDIAATTRRLSVIVENHIKTYPHEWFWLHNRWKTKPPAALPPPCLPC